MICWKHLSHYILDFNENVYIQKRPLVLMINTWTSGTIDAKDDVKLCHLVIFSMTEYLLKGD